MLVALYPGELVKVEPLAWWYMISIKSQETVHQSYSIEKLVTLYPNELVKVEPLSWWYMISIKGQQTE